MFFGEMAARLSTSVGGFAASFETPADASLLFSLLAILGFARVFHVVKQMDAEALARSAMIERLLRDGLGGILLTVFALTCLLLAGSRVGVALASAVILGHAWWDTMAIAGREHRSVVIRAVHQLTPFFALAFAAWGVGLAWFYDESISPGPGLSGTLPHLQRLEAYIQAWLQHPVTGYGLGSIDAVGDRVTTLWNAKAMLAPGDAQNVFVHWLVETGAVGLAVLVLALGAIYGRIFVAMATRRAPRTFARLAVAAGMLMLLHGVSDSSLGLPSAAWLFALLLGAASGISTLKRSERPQSDAAAPE
jgi:O-antigen ligase